MFVFVFSNLNVDPSNEGGRRDQGSQKPEEVTDPARLNIIVVNISMLIGWKDYRKHRVVGPWKTMKEDHRHRNATKIWPAFNVFTTYMSWNISCQAGFKIRSEIFHYQIYWTGGANSARSVHFSRKQHFSSRIISALILSSLIYLCYFSLPKSFIPVM